jgi:hypothetical protein
MYPRTISIINEMGKVTSATWKTLLIGWLVLFLISCSDLGLVDENAVSAAIAQGLQLECLGAELPEIAPELDSILPMKFCQKHFVVPLDLKANSLRLGMADLLDYPTIQDGLISKEKQI